MGPFRTLLLVGLARPLARFFTGADVIGREHLPTKGPAIVVANHNSHVDTLLLLSIFPARTLGCVRPAAAADYFLKDPMMSWFSRNIIGIVPVARDRAKSGEDILAPAREALAAGDIVVIFPEAPVIPVWIQGAGRVLPKGKVIPVPMNCAVVVGEPIRWEGKRAAFTDSLREALLALKAKAPPLRWA